ncbi:CcdC protein domain-containing protein [Bacillus sp. FJAT-49736]|uniref:CcdC protein domain-containing protein n=1 Tax=Bacillus sp. FJAT-49736 TaxID=2833582 RepID=UPI001BC9C57C|nr:CcdC protein domain-containing protein [Bacillus sp. FJAT-49736]MBS4175059.1 DUF1453 family protein [Bacillus sp. FJAT-49736]
MTQYQWDLIGYGVWGLIIWVTLKQFFQTRRDVTGSGLKLLLGDWLMFAPVPWIVYCLTRASKEEIIWMVILGIAAALPYIFTTTFVKRSDGTIRFKPNLFFYIFLFGFPYVRYLVRTNIFQTHPIFVGHTYQPDIELMLALYIGILVVYTFLWRTAMYVKYRALLKTGTTTISNKSFFVKSYRRLVYTRKGIE